MLESVCYVLLCGDCEGHQQLFEAAMYCCVEIVKVTNSCLRLLYTVVWRL